MTSARVISRGSYWQTPKATSSVSLAVDVTKCRSDRRRSRGNACCGRRTLQVPLSPAAAVGNRAQAALAELLLRPLAPLMPIEPAPEAVHEHVLVTVVVSSPLRHASIIGTAMTGVDVRRTARRLGGAPGLARDRPVAPDLLAKSLAAGTNACAALWEVGFGETRRRPNRPVVRVLSRPVAVDAQVGMP